MRLSLSTTTTPGKLGWKAGLAASFNLDRNAVAICKIEPTRPGLPPPQPGWNPRVQVPITCRLVVIQITPPETIKHERALVVGVNSIVTGLVPASSVTALI